MIDNLSAVVTPFVWDKDEHGCRCVWNDWAITGDIGGEGNDPVVYVNTGESITARVFDWLNVSTVDELAALAEEMAIAAYVKMFLVNQVRNQ